MITWILLGILHAEEPATRGLLFRQEVVPSAIACPTTPPTADWRLRVGHAKARNEAEGIAAARKNARRALEDDLCAGIEGSPRCLAAIQQIAPYGEGRWDRRTRAACATVAVPTRVLAGKRGDLDELDAALAALGSEVTSTVGARPVQLVMPVWSETGCPAGELGAYLTNGLKSHLSALADGEPDAAQVRLSVAYASERVSVSAALWTPGERWTSLGALGQGFPMDLFQIDPTDTNRCLTDEALGLKAEGLSVRLENASGEWLVCEGERVAPSLSLTAPARVRLYSVEADGNGYLAWPWRAEDDRVYGPDDQPDLPGFIATRTSDGTDSRLVAVAYPTETAPDIVPGFCSLPSPLRLDALPDGVEVSTLSFHVSLADERLCRGRGDTLTAEQARAKAHQIRSAAPTCR